MPLLLLVEVILAGYHVSSLLRNKHDSDTLSFLAAIADSVATIKRDSSGLMATLASFVDGALLLLRRRHVHQLCSSSRQHVHDTSKTYLLFRTLLLLFYL